MSTDHYITANQSGLNTGTGDTVYLMQGVAISGTIDMRGGGTTAGGENSIFVNGTIFGRIEDRGGSLNGVNGDGGNFINISSTGTIQKDSWGAIDLGGGGNQIVNAGLIASTYSANAIYIYESSGDAHFGQTESIINSGTITGQGEYQAGAIEISCSGNIVINNSGLISSSNGGSITPTPIQTPKS